MKKVLLKNLAIFTGKHVCWGFLLIKLQVSTFLKKSLRHQRVSKRFPVHLFKNIYFEEYLGMATSVRCCLCYYLNILRRTVSWLKAS